MEIVGDLTNKRGSRQKNNIPFTVHVHIIEIVKLHHRRPQTVGGFKKWWSNTWNSSDRNGENVCNKCRRPLYIYYMFILFGFACFVATLDAKNRWRKLRWGCNYLDPNARIKQHRTVKWDVLKASKDESERWHHSQSRSSVHFRVCAILGVR